MPFDQTPSSLVDDGLIARLSAEFALRAAEHDADASFPFENFATLHDAGLLALVDPPSVGGKGAGLRDARAVVAGVARGEPSTALVLALQYLIHVQIWLSPNWPAGLRERIARTAATDGAVINVLRVEPELGTPLRGALPATVARKVPGGWRISGTKLYSTGAPILTWLSVWARTDDAEPQVGAWIVPAGTEGVEIRPVWNHIGMRASGSHEVVFHDVFVPDGHKGDVRPPAEWAVPDEVVIAWNAALFATVYDSIARAARDWLLGFLHSRTPTALGGAALSTLPRLQEAVGAIEALLQTNRVLLRSLAAAVDGGTVPPVHESQLVKYTVTNNAIAAVSKAVEITGNPGLTRDNPLERHYRDVLCARVHAPQNDMILTAAGRAALAGP